MFLVLLKRSRCPWLSSDILLHDTISCVYMCRAFVIDLVKYGILFLKCSLELKTNRETEIEGQRDRQIT